MAAIRVRYTLQFNAIWKMFGRCMDMRDIKNHRVLWMKASLFLALGISSGLLLLVEAHTIRIAMLWALSVWAFCRAYYFAFYVIEHYIDPTYRFSGLLSVISYVRQRKARAAHR